MKSHYLITISGHTPYHRQPQITTATIHTPKPCSEDVAIRWATAVFKKRYQPRDILHTHACR